MWHSRVQWSAVMSLQFNVSDGSLEARRNRRLYTVEIYLINSDDQKAFSLVLLSTLAALKRSDPFLRSSLAKDPSRR
jgi:hypothetical protein